MVPLPVQVLDTLKKHQIAMKGLDLAHPNAFVCDANQSWGCLRPTAGEGVEEEPEAMWIAAQASLQPAAQFLESCVGDGEFTSGFGCSSWSFHKGAA